VLRRSAPTDRGRSKIVPALDLAPLQPGFWASIFGNDHPVTVEIGPGKGESLIHLARTERERNFFAIERSFTSARSIHDRLHELGLRNAHVIAGDAGCILALLPDACVAGYLIQFPDPWWKRRHWRRRLWSSAFVADIRRTMVPHGEVELVTDVEQTFDLAQRHLDADDGFEPVTREISNDASTDFARKALRHGATIRRSVHRRR
jgi:tRNA (guanine-N7-)-methyltransferase